MKKGNIAFLLVGFFVLNLQAQILDIEGDTRINGRITDVSDPVDIQDAATKAYVDQVLVDFALASIVDTSKTVQGLLNAGIHPSAILNEGIDSTHFIGRHYAGGIIFFMESNGTGFIVAPPGWDSVNDPDPSATWGCSGTVINGADSLTLGSGAQNTIDIENDCTTSGIAADICANLDFNGFDDWFLPSRDGLVQIHFSVGRGATGANYNIAGFPGTFYWSSSENLSGTAWWVDFADGSPDPFTKHSAVRVRPIRAF